MFSDDSYFLQLLAVVLHNNKIKMRGESAALPRPTSPGARYKSHTREKKGTNIYLPSSRFVYKKKYFPLKWILHVIVSNGILVQGRFQHWELQLSIQTDWQLDDCFTLINILQCQHIARCLLYGININTNLWSINHAAWFPDDAVAAHFLFRMAAGWTRPLMRIHFHAFLCQLLIDFVSYRPV